MAQFIKGMALCRDFFNDCAKTVIEYRFPDLKYSAGLIGYGSDVLGYDDAVSTDHMWGPRFYLFLSCEDIAEKEHIFSVFSIPSGPASVSILCFAPSPTEKNRDTLHIRRKSFLVVCTAKPFS